MEKLKIEIVGFNNPSKTCPHGYSCCVGSLFCRKCLFFKGITGGYIFCSFSEKTPESAENKPEERSVPADTRPEWEYLTIETAKPIDVKELDERGSEGWMMCGASYAAHFYYYFKRQKLS